MKKVMHILILSCKKAAELIDKKTVVQLSRKEKLQLQMHIAICEGCEVYQKQSKIIGELISKHFGENQIEKVTEVKNYELKKAINLKL